MIRTAGGPGDFLDFAQAPESVPRRPTTDVSVRRQDLERLMNASDELGFWMSAALDDPHVCAEMKACAQEWFRALGPFSKIGARGG